MKIGFNHGIALTALIAKSALPEYFIQNTG
jgi:hypothetical protein